MMKISPCPFCPSTEIELKESDSLGWIVVCKKCGAYFSDKIKEKAIKDWNWQHKINKIKSIMLGFIK